jgi:RND family efflux transporter MFP subunit
MKYSSCFPMYYCFLLLGLWGCNDAVTATENNSSFSKETEKIKVKVVAVNKESFKKEIISNGKLVPIGRADLKFLNSENISLITVKNGDRVKKGQLLAKLSDFNLLHNLKQSKEQFEKAKLEYQDMLIGLGINIRDSSETALKVVKNARIKSGYDKAQADLELAEFNYNASVLKAPFDGVVANLFTRENNQASTSEAFCSIIDDTKFEAEFFILEDELSFVRKGQTVRVYPFSYDEIEIIGQIARINPVIDKNGMVKVNAACNNKDNKLIEGMNVKVIIEESINDQIVVPYNSIVLRSNKEVVFTYSHGLVKWNYVKTGFKNASQVQIKDGLNPGDTVIVAGNLNLSQDLKVEIER